MVVSPFVGYCDAFVADEGSEPRQATATVVDPSQPTATDGYRGQPTATVDDDIRASGRWLSLVSVG